MPRKISVDDLTYRRFEWLAKQHGLEHSTKIPLPEYMQLLAGWEIGFWQPVNGCREQAKEVPDDLRYKE
jgi:hypothetical protein